MRRYVLMVETDDDGEGTDILRLDGTSLVYAVEWYGLQLTESATFSLFYLGPMDDEVEIAGSADANQMQRHYPRDGAHQIPVTGSLFLAVSGGGPGNVAACVVYLQ